MDAQFPAPACVVCERIALDAGATLAHMRCAACGNMGYWHSGEHPHATLAGAPYWPQCKGFAADMISIVYGVDPGDPAGDRSAVVTLGPKDARAEAESRIEHFVDGKSEEELALLFWLLRHGMGWTTERAETVLRNARWR